MIEVKAQGSGGLTEFKANLGENLAWGGFKCIAVDNREVCCRAQVHSSCFMFTTFLPTPPMTRKELLLVNCHVPMRAPA